MAGSADADEVVERARALLAATPDLVWFADADDMVDAVNDATADVLGWDPAVQRPLAATAFTVASRAVVEVDARPQLHAGRTWSGELTLRRSSGERTPVSVVMIPGLDEAGSLAWVGTVARDVRRLREREDLIRHQATHDTLTDLVNRTGFEPAATVLRAQGGIAVLLCGVDGLRAVNDTLGHEVGDALLVQVAQRLRACVRDGDVLARLDGDQFALALAGMSMREARAVADRILTGFRTPCTAAGQALLTNVSIGVAIAERGEAATVGRLLQDAEVAMHLAKSGGGGRVEVYDEAAQQRVLERLRLRRDLTGALDRGEFHLLYQPIVGLADGHVSSLEALLRWQHPDLGVISPLDFIPLLEEAGMIGAVGRWVLTEALQQLGRWQHTDPAAVGVSVNVNISPLQLTPSLVDEVAQALAESGIPPQQLILELTESAMARDPQSTVALLEELRSTGVRIALDDFGTGYSSLGRLQALPIDQLKIDRSFVQALEVTGDTALIAGICQMAAALGMRLVAEGIEHVEQACVLRALDCTSGQGYFWARPLPPQDVIGFIAGPPASVCPVP